MTDTPLITLHFEMPWPPSVNTYWRSIVLGGKFKKARSQVLISEQGRAYRVEVARQVLLQKIPRGALKGRLAVHATAHPPDARTRDLDNCWKGLLDALYHAGVIADDGHIDDLHIVRAAKRPPGVMRLRVSEIAHDPTRLELAFERAYANEPEPNGLLAKSVTIPPPF